SIRNYSRKIYECDINFCPSDLQNNGVPREIQFTGMFFACGFTQFDETSHVLSWVKNRKLSTEQETRNVIFQPGFPKWNDSQTLPWNVIVIKSQPDLAMPGGQVPTGKNHFHGTPCASTSCSRELDLRDCFDERAFA